MTINFIYKNKINTLNLPTKIFGKFWITFDNKNIISIDGVDEHWILVANRKTKIKYKDGYCKKMYLKDNCMIELEVENENALLYIEATTNNRAIFEKYEFKKDGVISIGSNEKNTIIYNNAFVSENHAKLTYHNGYWTINNLNKNNSTYVNNEKVDERTLTYGDVIFIMGLKIIVGCDFLAINNPDNKVKTELPKLISKKENELIEEEYENEIIEKEYFQRSPIFKKQINTKIINIESPPQEEGKNDTPMIMLIAPALTMGMSSCVTLFFTLSNGLSSGNIKNNMPTLVVSISMILGSVLMPTITRIYTKNKKTKKEKLRKEKYQNYLNEISKNIDSEIKKQKEILKENFPSIVECQNRIINKEKSLWERSINEINFLDLRLGTGNRKLDCDIKYEEKTFTLEEDILKTKMYEIAEKKYILENVPISISFYNNYISGIIGERKKVIDFTEGLIFEIASQYSYDEVKMIFIYNENQNLDYLKWLPHTFSNDKSFRFVATNIDEVKELSYYLNNELSKKENDKSMNPYYMIFVLDKDLGQKVEILKNIYKNDNIGFSIIHSYEKQTELPKDCTTIIEIKEEGTIYNKTSNEEILKFKPDIYLTADPNKLSKYLSNTHLNEESKYQLPEIIRFLELYGVGKIEHLNILNRWKENDPTKSLSVPIGVDSYGEKFYLDLHQKYHGPHGLIAGMTGSGKSEFIMTYILSLAVNFHPHDVSFILIDYKGGGMAKAFKNLPHTVGIITNLDGAGINRALISINSEIKRRQLIFDNTSNELSTSNIDIYKYQQLYKEGKVSIPMPHLLIISDEFAELKQQKPEFIEELISISRIGRSLGVHLILATQKPTGVVNDQIWSNSKFRVCLKVQEPSDSNGVIKRPDAAYLRETGRFYLQVGNNELFELGQSAWAGHKYIPNDKFEDSKEKYIEVIDSNARVIKKVKVDNNQLSLDNVDKEIEGIVKYISELQKKENIINNPIWLPPLDDVILLDSIIEKYYVNKEREFILEPLIGEYDDPGNQRKDYLRLNISKEGNTIIYSSQQDSSELLLTTTIYSLICNHTPNELNIYLLDFGGQSLEMFAEAPQVGDVIFSTDKEKVDNIFKETYNEIEKRRKLFKEYGGNYQKYIKENKDGIPSILIVINNYVLLNENYAVEQKLSYLTREGPKFGIFFIITTNTLTIRGGTKNNVKNYILLSLNDEKEYKTEMNRTTLIPKQVDGRGLIKLDKEVYEFQTAVIGTEKISEIVKEKCIDIKNKTKGSANKVAVLPDKIEVSDMVKYVDNTLKIPIGIEKGSLNTSYLDLEKNYITFCLSNNEEYIDFEENVSNMLANEYKKYEIVVVDPLSKLKKLNPNIKHIVGNNTTNEFIDEMYSTVLYRNNTYKEAIENNEEVEEFKDVVYIINSISDLLEGKDKNRIEKIDLSLLHGTTKYKIHILIFEKEAKMKWLAPKQWYQNNVKLDELLWFGNGVNDQYTINVKNKNTECNNLSNNSFAVKLENGTEKLIKVITGDKNG